jgi:hypothetical protein
MTRARANVTSRIPNSTGIERKKRLTTYWIMGEGSL